MPDLGLAADGLERKLATILAADVAAYSRLMAEDEEGTLQSFRGHKEVFEKLVALHRGRVFNTAGDAILAEFSSAVEAVRCATEIQAALRTRNDRLPPARRVEFRIGINLGDVVVQGGDLLGDGVNLAARLQTAAAPGGVCIAGSVYDQIQNKLSLSFKPLGDITYKNMPKPVRTFAIAAVAGLGPLPAPPPRREAMRGARRRPIVTALLILAGAAAIWGHASQRHHSAKLRASQASANHAATISAAADRLAVVAAPQTTTADPNRTQNPNARVAEASPNKAERSSAAADTDASDNTKNAVAAPDRGMAGDLSGIYGGSVCYGAFAGEPAHCFRAQAAVTHRRISGEWPGREHGVTMFLRGEIRRSGNVAIHMHARRADGSHFAASDLVGTLRDGRIEAAGVFRNGRSVSLTWEKN